MNRSTILTIALALSLPSPARAHMAAAGWWYDGECCSETDCREIHPSDVEESRAGWRVKATGEIISKSQTKRSGDEHFHRCTVGGDERAATRCLYVPEFGT